MGRKGNWFSSVKKAFSPESNEKKGQHSKKKWFGKEKSALPDSGASENLAVLHPIPPAQVVELNGPENEQTKQAYCAPVTTVGAAEPAAVAPQVTSEVVRLTTVARFTGKAKEEVAAIKIQTAFRGYLARRALRALRGLVRLKTLVQEPPVKRQTASALRCMQTLARVQSQIQSRRIRMLEENQALQRQLIQKRAKELANLQIGEEWDASLQSKEQIEASLLSKFEAAMRRERAMAYSFSHQQTWKKSTRSAPPMFMDPINPNWGWSWIERWSAGRPWEKELNNDQSPVKSNSLSLGGGEITKAYAKHLLNSDKSSPKPVRSDRSPSTPQSKGASSAVVQKSKRAGSGGSVFSPDDDAKSVLSMRSERNRRHSIAGSSVRDDESLDSSPAFPSYMAPTRSARAKSRMQSPSGLENGTPEKEPTGPTKKRLLYPASPAKPRRHSGPPRVDVSSIAGHNKRNGGGS